PAIVERLAEGETLEAIAMDYGADRSLLSQLVRAEMPYPVGDVRWEEVRELCRQDAIRRFQESWEGQIIEHFRPAIERLLAPIEIRAIEYHECAPAKRAKAFCVGDDRPFAVHYTEVIVQPQRQYPNLRYWRFVRYIAAHSICVAVDGRAWYVGPRAGRGKNVRERSAV